MRAYRVAYDGTGYRGFQRQPHGETVEDAILDALAALDVLDGEFGSGENEGEGGNESADDSGDRTGRTRQTPPGHAAAGRTDAGVSAVAQTVAFAAPDWLTPAALNGELPRDIRAWAAADASGEFHATHDARSRTYEYHLHAPESDDEAAAAALDALAGTHDVHNLTPDDAGTERDLTTAVERDGAFLVCRFEAGGFPREFVRRAVSLVAAVADGDRSLAFVDRVLAAEPLAGPDGVAPAPPEPLVLVDVTYPDLAFALDDEAAASAWTVFEARRVERATGARVASALRTGASRDA